jgi:hypothetical protein
MGLREGGDAQGNQESTLIAWDEEEQVIQLRNDMQGGERTYDQRRVHVLVLGHRARRGVGIRENC